MGNAIIFIGLTSVIVFSMGFLALALVMNRRWMKDQREQDNRRPTP